MIGSKALYGGGIKYEDGMYAYSDASNFVLVMVSGDVRGEDEFAVECEDECVSDLLGFVQQ